MQNIADDDTLFSIQTNGLRRPVKAAGSLPENSCFISCLVYKKLVRNTPQRRKA